jgi:hypothetical protein
MGYRGHRILATWTGEAEVSLWAAFFLAAIVGIFMARRDARPLLYWNLCCLATLIVASVLLVTIVERRLYIACPIVAAVAAYSSHRQVKSAALPN